MAGLSERCDAKATSLLSGLKRSVDQEARLWELAGGLGVSPVARVGDVVQEHSIVARDAEHVAVVGQLATVAGRANVDDGFGQGGGEGHHLGMELGWLSWLRLSLKLRR